LKLERISMAGIICIFSLCLSSSFSFALCPPGYPISCRHFFELSKWCCRNVGINDCTILIDFGYCIPDELDPCPVELIFEKHSEEIELIRYFRDDVLSKTPEGQELIRLYYQWSPGIVKAMEDDEEFKEEVKEMVDEILELIGEGGDGI